MITIYQYDTNGYATGNTREQSAREPIPPMWTHKQPKGVEGERFVGNVWQVVPLPPPDLSNVFTQKTDIIDRCTSEESEILDNALAMAPAKERMMFVNCNRIEHSSEYFPVLKTQITELLGAERAEELLAPSNQ